MTKCCCIPHHGVLRLVAALAEPYPGEKQFRDACNKMLGHWCLEECRNLARLFDRPLASLANAKMAQEVSWTGIRVSVLSARVQQEEIPTFVGNKVAKYTLKLDDCEECLAQNNCLPRPRSSAQSRTSATPQ